MVNSKVPKPFFDEQILQDRSVGPFVVILGVSVEQRPKIIRTVNLNSQPEGNLLSLEP